MGKGKTKLVVFQFQTKLNNKSRFTKKGKKCSRNSVTLTFFPSIFALLKDTLLIYLIFGYMVLFIGPSHQHRKKQQKLH